MRRSSYGYFAIFILAAVIGVSIYLTFSEELGLANAVRKKCLFAEICEVPMSSLYESVDWDTLCYETYRPLTEEQREKYGCEFCRILTLKKAGMPVYSEAEEYVMEERLAKSTIFLPENKREGVGVECFDKKTSVVRGVKRSWLNILKQEIYLLEANRP